LRPTSERVREALFARLGDVAGLRVLDCFAGTGALGIEALSRGAAEAVFLERASAGLRLLHRNLEELGLRERSRVVAGDALRTIATLARSESPFDLCFVDPPWKTGLHGPCLAALRGSGVVHAGTVAVVECDRRSPLESASGWTRRSERSYGDTVIAEWVADGAPADDREVS